MENQSKDMLWVDDIGILFNLENLTEFFPTTSMSSNRKLNAVTRLAIYTSLLLFVYNRNINSLFLAAITMVIIFLVYQNKNNQENYNKLNIDEENTEHLLNTNDKNKCEESSVDNPFMNVLMTDYQDNPMKKPACKSEFSKPIKNDVELNFNENLYKDVSNVFNKANSQRQFYTNPNTSIPNNQGDFASWLYGVPKTCKEGNGEQCVANNQYRLNGSSRLPIDIY